MRSTRSLRPVQRRHQVESGLAISCARPAASKLAVAKRSEARERLRGHRREVMLEGRNRPRLQLVLVLRDESGQSHVFVLLHSRLDGGRTVEQGTYQPKHQPKHRRGHPAPVRALRHETAVETARPRTWACRALVGVLRAHHAPALEARAQRVRVQPQPAGRAALAFDHPAGLRQHLLDVPALHLGDGPRSGAASADRVVLIGTGEGAADRSGRASTSSTSCRARR